jgi:hypothetical protein
MTTFDFVTDDELAGLVQEPAGLQQDQIQTQYK